ncbi:MAG TPA: metallophosphoesterase [Myxococcaceae bacterium]|nr:metallophosphoesterase [Myxococcaceae bacterium]
MSPRRRSGFLVPFLTALALFALLHAYVARRLFVDPVLSLPITIAGCGLLALLVVLVPVGFLFSRRDRGWPSRVFPPLAVGWLGASGVLLTVTVMTDLGRLFYRLLHRWPDAAAALYQARAQAVLIALGTALLVPFAIWTARGRLVLSQVRVPLAHLAPGVAGLRIVQISDLHIGDRLGEDFLRRVVDRVNALRPDVVAITGDLVDGPAHIVEQALRPLADLDAPHGVYFVTGNHEYYWGGRESVRMVEQLGLTVLHNEHRVVERGGGRLVIGGMPDLHGGRFLADHQSRPELVFAGAPEGVPRVLLAHQPRAVTGAAPHGVDLQLSGHTHGGQIFPFHLFVRLQQPVVRGLRKLLGVWVYAHRGTGFWGPPMRLFSTPEIAEITLTPAG